MLLTDWRQLILYFQNHALANVLQEADNLIMTELGKVDAVYTFNVVPYIQLVAPVKNTKNFQISA